MKKEENGKEQESKGKGNSLPGGRDNLIETKTAKATR